MGNDVSRSIGLDSHHSGGAKMNIESTYAEEYKRASLDDVTACVLRLARELGRDRMAITASEFHQVFKGILADPLEHFSLFDARGRGVIDVNEVFAAVFLFSGGSRASLEAKVIRLFALFDFDGDEGLDEVEVEMMLECVVKGASRAALVPLPDDVIESAARLTKSMFHFAKQPLESGTLTVRDVKEWVIEKEDVSAYLSNYTQARMIVSSLKLVEESIARTADMFAQAAAQDEDGDGMIDAGKAMDILRSVIVLVDMEPALRRDKEAAADAAITAAARILTASSAARCNIKKIRGERVDLAVMKEFMISWVAFSVVDDEGNGSVGSKDIKALIWFSGGARGDEPSEAAIQKTMDAMEESRNGVIDRMMWIRYTAVLDEGRGSHGFDGGLLNVFRRYDDDRSGSVTANEMGMMVRDSVVDAVTEAPGRCSLRPDMEAVVETMVQDIAKDLVTVMDGAGSGLVGWTQFKKHQNLVATRLATLRDFVLSVAVRRGPATSSEAARATDAKRNGAIGGAGESDDGDNDSV